MSLPRFGSQARLIPLAIVIHLLAPAVASAGEGSRVSLSLKADGNLGKGDMGALWIDANRNGHLELLFINHIAPLGFWRFDQQDAPTDFIEHSGVSATGRDRHGASCGDFDNDGRPDVYVTNGADRGKSIGAKSDELWRNAGDLRFVDFTAHVGPLNRAGRGRSASWVDFDNDGWLDIYVSNFQTGNVLLKNAEGKGFSDVTERVGLTGLEGPSAWSDVDGDGDADLALGRPLRLFLNENEARFKNVTGTHVPRGVFAFSLAWGDVDGDGDDDLFTTTHAGGGQLLKNDAGQLATARQWRTREPTRGSSGAGAVWGDLDNDGDLDLLHVRSGGVSIYENQDGQLLGGRTDVFAQAGAAATGGDPALGDLDNDGDLDAAIDRSTGNVLLKNELEPERNWMFLSLRGSQSNAMGFGARVQVFTDGQLLGTRQYFGDNGRLTSAGCAPMHFGLGNSDSVALKIAWPSGVLQTVQGVGVNQAIELSEPDETAR